MDESAFEKMKRWDYEDMDEALAEQPCNPCPKCGKEPHLVRNSRYSDWPYTPENFHHRDFKVTCDWCGRNGPCGKTPKRGCNSKRYHILPSESYPLTP